MKNIKYCPVCAAKKLIHSFQQKPFEDEKYDKDVCPLPPMGWSSWNLFRNKINEDLIKEISDAMEKTGLKDAGYKYVNIDDCWQDSSRDVNGRICCDPHTFPSGIKALSEYVNSNGMKLGIYSSNGELTCEDYPASLGYERQDAETFAEWGIEYFKYDFCHHKPIPTEAPLITGLNLKSENGEKIILKAENATLRGNARIVYDDSCENGCYLKGLSSRSGTAEFCFEAPESGIYSATLIIRKKYGKDKFLILTVNGKDSIDITTPGTKAWSSEGKAHISLTLNKGQNSILLSNPIGSARDGYAYQYAKMGKELKRATAGFAKENNIPEKKITYSICEWGLNHPWKWAPKAGNLWRTTPDIKPNWFSILGIYEINIRLGKYAGVGSYNDPDMLEVGNGELKYEENFSHFTLWCMMASPLILGNDVRKYIKADGSIDKDNKIYQILTNKDLIAIDQDKLCIPCKRISTNKGVDTLVKPLSGNRAAICFFNKTSCDKTADLIISDAADTAEVNLPSKGSYKIKNLRTGEICNSGFISCNIKPHGVQIFTAE